MLEFLWAYTLLGLLYSSSTQIPYVLQSNIVIEPIPYIRDSKLFLTGHLASWQSAMLCILNWAFLTRRLAVWMKLSPITIFLENSARQGLVGGLHQSPG
jgi:hypothetical protein